jgi:hypothetical protein
MSFRRILATRSFRATAVLGSLAALWLSGSAPWPGGG